MIEQLRQNAETVRQYDRFELTFQLSKNCVNPFDPQEVDVTATFIEPDHLQVQIPGFYYQNCKLVCQDGKKTYEKQGQPSWKVRFTPSKPGHYLYEVTVRYGEDGETSTETGEFICESSSAAGFIRNRDRQYLFFDDESPYVPIGINLGWGDNDEIDWFASRLQKLAATGANWTRIWMTNWGGVGMAIEWSPQYAPGHEGVGRYSLEIAWKLDQLIQLLESYGIALQLVLEPHANWDDCEDWGVNPYNRAMDGGWLDEPGEFFSDADARRAFKNRLRYIVARWGYSTSILAWELFNEVQNVDGFQENVGHVVGWHQEMSQYLRSIDPVEHLITTSATGTRTAGIWWIPTIDLVQPHLYTANTVDNLEAAHRSLRVFDKPVMFGEQGSHICDVTYPEDDFCRVPEPAKSQMKAGLHLHNGMWSATHLGTSAMLWYWNFVDNEDLYGHLKPLADYWKGEWPGADLRPANVEVTDSPLREGLWISTGVLEFFEHATQTNFHVRPDGSIPGSADLHSVLHGKSKNHNRTDPTFWVTLAEDGVFRIRWDTVSEDGATLAVHVNGQPPTPFSFAIGAKCGSVEVPVPAGRRRVQVRNTGNDWIQVEGYEFTGFRHPAIKVVGIASTNRAFLWFYDVGRKLHLEPTATTFANVGFILNGLADGKYSLQAYSTKPGAGGLIQETKSVSAGGRFVEKLPSFEHDVAVKIKAVN